MVSCAADPDSPGDDRVDVSFSSVLCAFLGLPDAGVFCAIYGILVQHPYVNGSAIDRAACSVA